MVTVSVPANNTKALLAAAKMFIEIAEGEVPEIEGFDASGPYNTGDKVTTSKGVQTIIGGADLELDADDLPWDERIHASTKSKTQDGRWKKKRGVSEEEYNAVIAELKLDAEERDEYEDYEQDLTMQAAVQPVPPPTAETEAPTPPAPPATSKYNKYADIYEALEPNGLTMDDLTVACQAAGLKFPAMLAARPDLVPQIAKSLGLE